MTKLICALTIIIVSSFFGNTYGQNSKATIPEPEFLNQINFLEKQTNTLQKLEKTTAQLKSKIKGLGYGGSEIQYQVEGGKSSVQLPSQDSYSFVVSFGEGMGEPSAWFTLHKAEIKKEKRQAVYFQASMTGKTKNPDNLITYDVRKVKDKVYEIIPSSTLAKGEYFFVNKGSAAKYNGQAMEVFCFSIN